MKSFGYYLYVGDLKSASQLLETGFDINECNQSRVCPIISAINCDKPDIVKFVIDNGADVNKDTGDGWTPLHEAFDIAIDGIVQNYLSEPYPEAMEIIRLLISNGADLMKKNAKGKTPLDSLNTYIKNLEFFNSIRQSFKKIIPNIDELISFDINKS